MPVLDALDLAGLDHAGAVDEALGRDQHAVEEHRVVGRDPEIADRHAFGQRSGLEADRQHLGVAVGETADIAAVAEPLDRALRADEVMTRSPMASVSTATSPRAVRIRVLEAKQIVVLSVMVELFETVYPVPGVPKPISPNPVSPPFPVVMVPSTKDRRHNRRWRRVRHRPRPRRCLRCRRRRLHRPLWSWGSTLPRRPRRLPYRWRIRRC